MFCSQFVHIVRHDLLFYNTKKLYATTMSEFENVEDLKVEIQKLLGEINKDMSKLKSEVASLHHIVEKDASLPINAKLVNERLMIAAKEAGINLDDVEVETSDEETSEHNASEHDSSEENESERENVTQESTRNDEPTASTSNAASIAAATDKLKQKVKRTLR